MRKRYYTRLTIGERTFRVEPICPPIPARCFDWAATCDDCAGEVSAASYGATEAEAIEAAFDHIDEYHDESTP